METLHIIFTLLWIQALLPGIQGVIVDILDECCMKGTEWGSKGERCDSYSSVLPDMTPENYGNCRRLIEVCCTKQRQQSQCDLGMQSALDSNICVMRMDEFGAEQYMECCHCCHLGLSQRAMGGECTLLTNYGFGGPCDVKFQECCFRGNDNSNVSNQTVNDIDECAVYDGMQCDQTCVNTIGSYRCDCEEGYVLQIDGFTCRRNDSTVENCDTSNPCDQICIVENGAVKCDCRTGYELMDDDLSCEDVDECKLNLDTCEDGTRCVNTDGSYKCELDNIPSCPLGTIFNPQLQSCVRTCGVGEVYDPREQKCVRNSVECGSGLARNTVTGECEDIDECTVFLHNCHGIHMACVNTYGGFRCRCEMGYEFDNLTNTCQDIDECASHTDTCLPTQRCENTLGSFVCRRILGCGTGYSLDSNSQTCLDIDECALGTHDCSVGYTCVNYQGSYRCTPTQCPEGQRFSRANGRCEEIQCPPGLRADRRGLCRDIDECKGENNCSELEACENTYGSYTCKSIFNCKSGYFVNPVTKMCEDIDECSRNMDDCRADQVCLNRPGSFICNCPAGLRMKDGICEDVNECAENFVCPFNAVCENTMGSYQCVCADGLRLQGRRCIDINECETPNRCQHRCVNVYGSFHCQCYPGYRLADDRRTCEDIDECTLFSTNGNALCGGNCINTPGSYTCSCPAGWTSVGGGRSCRDIDECVRNPGICGQNNDAVCFNTRGSYKCPEVVCPPGFVKTSLGPRRNRVQRLANAEPDLLESFKPRSRLATEDGVLCTKGSCPPEDMECLINKVRSVTFQFVSLPSVPVLREPVALLNVQTVSYLMMPNLKFFVMQGDDNGIFRAVSYGNSAALQLVKPVIGPAEFNLTLRLENWNILGNQLFSIYLTHAIIHVSDRDWN